MYAPPFGENYEGIGVKPHIEVDMPANLAEHFYELTHEQDPQLMKAIEVVKDKIAHPSTPDNAATATKG
jgi:C-terminal processing protease CtpA/Prc